MTPIEAPEATSTSVTVEPPVSARRSAKGPFSDAEWDALKTSDKYAGGTVVALIASIFTVGLLLYTTILIVACL